MMRTMSYEANPDQEHLFSLGRLFERGFHRIEWVLPTTNERNEDDIDADIYWVRFEPPQEMLGGTDLFPVEGKIYLPHHPNKDREAIQFTPGYPGGQAGRFEKAYARAIVKAGYGFITLRHNGAPLQHPKSSAGIMNCQERLEYAQTHGQKFIGVQPSSGFLMTHNVYEPLVALEAIHRAFGRIHLIGQSFGVTSNYNSVDRLRRFHPSLTKKIGNIVSISGWLGGIDDVNDSRLKGFKVDIQTMIDRNLKNAGEDGINIDSDRQRQVAAMQMIAQRTGRVQIPEHIGQVLLVSPDDPMIATPETEWVREVGSGDVDAERQIIHTMIYPGNTQRTLIIKDASGKGNPKQHTMLWITPENMLRAVRMKVSSHGPHYVEIQQKGSARTGAVRSATPR